MAMSFSMAKRERKKAKKRAEAEAAAAAAAAGDAAGPAGPSSDAEESAPPAATTSPPPPPSPAVAGPSAAPAEVAVAAPVEPSAAPDALEPPSAPPFRFVLSEAVQRHVDMAADSASAAALIREREARREERADTYRALVDKESDNDRLQQLLQEKTQAANRLRTDLATTNGRVFALQTEVNGYKNDLRMSEANAEREKAANDSLRSLFNEHRESTAEHSMELFAARQEIKRLTERSSRVELDNRTLLGEVANMKQRLEESEQVAAENQGFRVELQQVNDEFGDIYRELGDGLQARDYLAHIRQREADDARRNTSPDRRSSPSREGARQVSGTSMHEELAQQGYDSDAEHAEEDAREENERLKQEIRELEASVQEQQSRGEEAARQQVASAEQQAHAANLQVQELQAQLDNLTNDLRDMTRLKDTTRLELRETILQAEFAEQETEVVQAELDKTVNDHKASLQAAADAQQRRQIAEQQIQRVQAELDEATTELKAMADLNAIAQQEVEASKKQTQAAERKTEHIQARLNSTENDYKILADLAANNTSQIEAAKKETGEVQAEHGKTVQDLNAMADLKTTLVHELEAANQRSQVAHQKTQELQTKLDKAIDDLKTMADVKAASEQAETAMQRIVVAEKEAEVAKQELGTANRQLETLNQQTRELQTKLDKTTADLNAVAELKAITDAELKILADGKATVDAQREAFIKLRHEHSILDAQKEIADDMLEKARKELRQMKDRANQDVASIEKEFGPHEGGPYLQLYSPEQEQAEIEENLNQARAAYQASELRSQRKELARPTTSVATQTTSSKLPVALAHKSSHMPSWLRLLILAILGLLVSLVITEWTILLAANDSTRQRVSHTTLDYEQPYSPPSLLVGVGTMLGVDYRTLG